MSEEKNRPIFKSRVGSCEASVWEQDGANGKFFTISSHRNYKDEKESDVNNQWKSTQSLRVNDLQDMKLALSDCHRFCKQTAKELVKKEAENKKE